MKTTPNLTNLITENKGKYTIKEGITLDELIAITSQLISNLFTTGTVIGNPEDIKKYIRIQLAKYIDREVFAVVLLDNRHQIVAFKKLFFGTIDSCSVYPREIVSLALRHRAVNAVVAVHNHPSGIAEPSQSDENITQRIKDALATVDIKLLDHIILGKDSTVSLAERGLL